MLDTLSGSTADPRAVLVTLCVEGLGWVPFAVSRYPVDMRRLHPQRECCQAPKSGTGARLQREAVAKVRNSPGARCDGQSVRSGECPPCQFQRD